MIVQVRPRRKTVTEQLVEAIIGKASDGLRDIEITPIPPGTLRDRCFYCGRLNDWAESSCQGCGASDWYKPC